LIESVNTKIRLLTRIAFGIRSPPSLRGRAAYPAAPPLPILGRCSGCQGRFAPLRGGL
jgi:hypothetical protein